MRPLYYSLCFSLALVFTFSCAKKNDDSTTTDIEETGQQVGDTLSSIDESGGSGGSFASLEGASRTFARLAPDSIAPSVLDSLLIPKAFAASCFTLSTFGSCTSNVITRTFSDCTMGALTLSGTVTLTFSDAATDNTCQMASTGHSITRSPNFTVTGRRGATLTVSKTGTNGQVITKTGSGTFTFSNDGIQRVFKTSDGSKLFDFTTKTTSDITVSGTTRSGRTVSGGALRVTNNLTEVTCDFTPSSVTWTSTCNCPTSGSLSGSCSDGKTTLVEITGCGTAKLTLGSDSQSFTFDRCYGS